MKIFKPNEFIMKTVKGMIGNYPDFQAREYALDWWKLGKLSDDEMAELETLIEAQYTETETETEVNETEMTETETEIEETVTETEETETEATA